MNSGVMEATVHEASVDGIDMTFIVGRNSDGSLKDLHAKTCQHGSLINGLLDTTTGLINRMLKYGIPQAEIEDIINKQRFEPRGIVTGHPQITECESVLDLIAKVMRA